MKITQPTEKQQEAQTAIESGKFNVILYGGAIRGGKTYFLISTFLTLCRVFPNSRYVIIRESLPQIRINLLSIFEKLVPKKWTSQMPSQSNNWTWKCTNGSKIIFFSENYDRDKDLERFKGLEADGFGIDEISEIQEETFWKCIERKGTWMMAERMEQKQKGNPVPPQLILATCNPTQNWVKERFYDRYVEGTLPDTWLYINSRVYDNPYIDSQWIEERRQIMPKEMYLRFIEGDWDVNANDDPWLYAYDENRHIANLKANNDQILFSHDFNVNPCVAIAFQTDFSTYLHVLEEFEINQKESQGLEVTRALVRKKIKPKYPEKNIMITGDASGSNSQTQSQMHNYEILADEWDIPKNDSFFRVRNSNIPLTESEKLCNTAFHVMDIKIDENCKNLRKDCRNAVFEDGKLFKDNNEYGMHFFDTLRYAVDCSFPDLLSNPKKYLH